MLERLGVFMAVAEAGGFTAAAGRLRLTKAAVSRQVAALEAELGAALFTRTTRRVALTEAGERLFEESAPLLHSLQAVLAGAGAASAQLRGTLRLTAPADYMSAVLAPRLVQFRDRHPALRIEAVATDEPIDLVAGRIDVAVRMGALRDSSLRLVALGHFDQWVVGSPEYLQRSGKPERPADLALHHWVAFTRLRSPLGWTFTRPGARAAVRVQAPFSCNTPAAALALVRAGAGLTVLADTLVGEDVRQGRLVRLFPDWSLPRGGIFALVPASRFVPARTRAFVEFLRG